MVQGTPQFTPAQVLEAGRRAEAEGKLDYAVQFYRHLATHYPSTSEAQVARDGLQRLTPHHQGAANALAGLNGRPGDGGGAPAPRTGPPPIQPQPQPHMNGSTDAHHYVPGGGPSGGLPPAQAGGGGPPPQQARPVGPAPAPMAGPQRNAAIQPASAARAPRLEVEVRDRYRAGRFLSRLFTIIGFGSALVGLLLVLLAVFGGMMPRIINALPETLKLVYAFGTYVGVSLLATGLTLALWGQSTRSSFDTANATQDLLDIERQKLNLG